MPNHLFLHHRITLLIHRFYGIAWSQRNLGIAMVFGIRYDETRPVVGAEDAIMDF